MIPLRDTLTLRTTPWVNYALISACVALFGVQWLAGTFGERLVEMFGFIPARLFHPSEFDYFLHEALLTLITSIFFHGGLVHLGGNMLFLAIFGNDVEERLGHIRYFLFFLFAGVAGSLSHAALYERSTIPSIGASGSIAGVLGMFLVLHTHARIITLIPLVVSWALIEIPAVVFVPIWFLMQFLNGWMSLASARGVQEVAGVAWWAHVGGFVIGALAGVVARVRSRDRELREPDREAGEP